MTMMEKFRFRKKETFQDDDDDDQGPPPYPGHSQYFRQGQAAQQQQQHHEQQQLPQHQLQHQHKSTKQHHLLPNKAQQQPPGYQHATDQQEVPRSQHQHDSYKHDTHHGHQQHHRQQQHQEHHPQQQKHHQHQQQQQQHQPHHHHHYNSYQDKRPKQITNWNGVMQDLFGMDSPHTAESTHESTSSGVASDVTSVFPSTPTLTTFKGGDSNGSDGHSQDSGTRTASVTSSPKPGHKHSNKHHHHHQHHPVLSKYHQQQQQQLTVNGNREGSPAGALRVPISPVPRPPSANGAKPLSPTSIQGRELPQPPTEKDGPHPGPHPGPRYTESPTLAGRGRKAKDRIGKIHGHRGRTHAQNGPNDVIDSASNDDSSNSINKFSNNNGRVTFVDQDGEGTVLVSPVDPRSIDPSFYNEINQCYVEATREDHFIHPYGDDRYIESHIQKTVVQNDRLQFIPSPLHHPPSPIDNNNRSSPLNRGVHHPIDHKPRQQRQPNQHQHQHQHQHHHHKHSNANNSNRNLNHNHQQSTYHQMHPSSRQHFTSSPHGHHGNNLGFKSTGDIHASRELSNRFANDVGLSSPTLAHPMVTGSSSESPCSDRRTLPTAAAEKDFDNIFCENLKPINKNSPRVILTTHAQVHTAAGAKEASSSSGRPDYGSSSPHIQAATASTRGERDGVGTPVPVPRSQGGVSFGKGKRLTSRSSVFDSLPNDILLRILSHLPTDHLCRCAQVCRQWYNAVWDNPILWKAVVINNANIDIDKALKYLTRRLSYSTPKVCMILEKVNINGSVQLTDRGLQTVAKRCPELRYLDLQGCHQLTNLAVTEAVSRCVNLERLDVTGCLLVTCISLTESVLSQSASRHLQRIYLRYLDMTDCAQVSDGDLSTITSQCTQLLFLYLRRCPLISDLGVTYIANNCSSLRELSVSDCKAVTDLGLRELGKLGDNLRYLSVAKCERVSDQGVMHIARACSKLRYLNVRGCEGVSDTALEFLAQSCQRLKSLDIGKCDITDDGLYALSIHCPNLRKLSIKSCDAITDKGVVLLAYRCRALQQLSVQDCCLSVEAYNMVRKYCKKALIEHTNPGFV